MSRIFRSEAVQPGDRVVVRRQRGDHASDVIGHVIGLDPLTIRPQAVGGLPSQAPAIEITEPHIVRRLSPRTVRNSDIRALETASAKAFPGSEHLLIDGWLARAATEPAPRSNSATPIGHSAGFAPVPLAPLASFYAERGAPLQLLVPERIGKPAQRLIDAEPERWRLGGELLVMSVELAEGAFDADPRVVLDEVPHPQWLAMCRYRGRDLSPAEARDLVRPIDGQLRFARLVQGAGTGAGPGASSESETAAVARVALTTSEDGRAWLGISAVEVGERWRRQANGSKLVESILAWGAATGVDAAYLQVQASNEAAVAMYGKLGFIEHHRHRYARLG